jgi:hypothetical protein
MINHRAREGAQLFLTTAATVEEIAEAQCRRDRMWWHRWQP